MHVRARPVLHHEAIATCGRNRREPDRRSRGCTSRSTWNSLIRSLCGEPVERGEEVEIVEVDGRRRRLRRPPRAGRGYRRSPFFFTPSSAVQVSGPTIAIGSMPLTCLEVADALLCRRTVDAVEVRRGVSYEAAHDERGLQHLHHRPRVARIHRRQQLVTMSADRPRHRRSDRVHAGTGARAPCRPCRSCRRGWRLHPDADRGRPAPPSAVVPPGRRRRVGRPAPG